ncbi:MAG TPA: alkaline phosphatase family protein [Pyrinomonadaceae bacterium]|nr:alkaline phosphatase family protein [Pyrinomonadaceae bacterium]
MVSSLTRAKAQRSKGERKEGFQTSLRLSLRLCVFARVILLLLCVAGASFAQTKRLVVIQCDGLPYDIVDRFVKQRDPQSGKSLLPWIDYIFYQRGSRLSNFYVRGMSLSAPSWSLLQTGQHLQIKGNVEFDRYTLYPYDYLNFIPFYVSGITGSRVDMRAVEVMDSLGLPLLSDAYPHNERYITYSLFLRGPRYSTLQNSLQNRFLKSPKELFDEWTMGFELRGAVTDQLVRELITKLNDPKIRYLDLMMADYDHIAHHNNDLQSQLLVLKQMDAVMGQIWTAIQKSPLADETAMVVISDHGFNTDERIYSQGYNLVKLLGSRAGGGHHVVTKRRLMLDYSIKGIDPLVPLITTTTPDSYYLKGESTDYPTAMLDFDGNERASVHLRDSDLNQLHILLKQLQDGGLSESVDKAATNEFFAIIDRRRAEWTEDLKQLQSELGAVDRAIVKQRKLWESQPKKFTKEQQDAGLDDASKRIYVQLDRWQNEQRQYGEYARTLHNLLSLSSEAFAPSKVRISDVIPKTAMGDRNTIYELQNYVAGVGPNGLVLNSDGSLDVERSFVHIDYFSLLQGIAVRNNVQRGVSNRPIDLIATRISRELVLPLIDDRDIDEDVVWVTTGANRQALLLARHGANGELSFRYLPISDLRQDANGRLQFTKIGWQAGLPLQMFEDPNLNVPGDRAAWLSQWHTDVEWLEALHRTHYSNGLIGLHEELARHPVESLSAVDPSLSEDERLMRDYARRKRELIEADMLIVAQNHWNFDVRGFNPGGNHGSFFRISTHSTFMIAGGQKTNIPRALDIDAPYDSLSFIPTLLALTRNLRDDNSPVPELWQRGFRPFPGRVVKELLLVAPEKPSVDRSRF